MKLKSILVNPENKIILIIVLLLVVFSLSKIPSVVSWGNSSNYKNYSVRTTVNVTNAYPEILNITCNNDASFTLNAGTTKTIVCIVQIRDYNGWNDINYANATFYYNVNESSDPDDNNEHYTNGSCLNTSNDGQYLANWTCSFNVWHYAFNGTWYANSTVNDSYGAQDNDYGTATIDALLALNVTPVINFGNMAVTDTSASSEQANITNFGNVDINVTVYGFGGNNMTGGSGFAMICEQRNLTLPNERYDLNPATGYPAMTRISGVANQTGLTIIRQTNDAQQEINSTYWRLHINLTTNPYGICNGTVVFSAESP